MLRAGPVLALCACALLVLAAPAPAVITSALHPLDPRPMPPGVTTTLYAPTAGPAGDGSDEWNVYGDGGETLMGAGFTTNYGDPIAELSSPFSAMSLDGNHWISGTVYSEVYRHAADKHLLFVYTFTNDDSSNEALAYANLIDWDNVKIIDAGEMSEEAGIVDFYTYQRLAASPGELTYAWDKTGDVMLEPGDVSTHGYAETNVPFITRGEAAILNTGVSAHQIPVLVPTVIPEPLTMLGLFMGLGTVGAYIRKRRMA